MKDVTESKRFWKTINPLLREKNKTEICPVYKKLDNTSKENYRPINTLLNFTKLFESILFTQLNRYMQNKFWKYLTGFRKNNNTQNSLLRMVESWKVRLNNGSKVGVIIMDLSKAFDSLNHKLLLTKLKAYGLDSNSVTFMKSYLTNRLQRCKISSSFSEWGKYLMVSHKDLFLSFAFQHLSKWDFSITSKLWLCKLCRWQYFVYIW